MLQAWEGMVEACREPELEQGAPQALEGDGKVWEVERQQSVPSPHTSHWPHIPHIPGGQPGTQLSECGHLAS